jgi:hypothetical protein
MGADAVLANDRVMETRMFDRPVTVQSADGQHSEAFNRGDRVKNIRRIRQRVMFDPVSTHRVARIYVMDWIDFEKITTAVREAQA